MFKRNLVLSIGVVLVVFVVGYNAFTLINAPQFDIRELKGSVININASTILINGSFSTSEAIPEALKTDRDFAFLTDGNTKFDKLEIIWPSWEKLGAGGATSGVVDLGDLPQDKGAGSLDDLKRVFSLNAGTVYVEANFTNSIYRSKNPIAESVYYRIIVMPTPIPKISP